MCGTRRATGSRVKLLHGPCLQRGVMKIVSSAAARAVVLSMAGWALTVSAANAAQDPGVRAGPGAGDPVPGLSANQMTLFLNGQKTFEEVDAVGDGLGPRFNLDSCLGCHAFPTHGGSAPAVNPQATLATAMGAKNTSAAVHRRRTGRFVRRASSICRAVSAMAVCTRCS